MRWKEDACLVEEAGARVVDQEIEGGKRPDEVGEGVGVDEEGSVRVCIEVAVSKSATRQASHTTIHHHNNSYKKMFSACRLTLCHVFFSFNNLAVGGGGGSTV